MKHPVDVHVGKRIRHRRWMVGMTQQQLGEIVGIKFQQIQKYETGMNRVSASRLWDISEALDVSISFFFEGINATDDDAVHKATSADQLKGDLLADKEALQSRNRNVAACLTWHAYLATLPPDLRSPLQRVI